MLNDINVYLEKAPRGAYKKYVTNKMKAASDLNKKADKYEKIAEYNPHAKAKMDAIVDKADKEYTDVIDKTGYTPETIAGMAKGNKKWAEHVQQVKKKFGQGKDNMKSKLETKPSGLYATKKESVMDTIERANVAFEEGTISEEDRDYIINMLNEVLESCED